VNAKISTTYATSTSRSTISSSSYKQAQYATATVVAPAVDVKGVKVLTVEDVEEVAQMLHNLLQDSLITCEEDCCIEESNKIDFTDISLNIIKLITADYSIGVEEKQQLMSKLAATQLDLSNLKKQMIMSNHKEAEGLHEKRLNNFKSRSYNNPYIEEKQ